MLLESRNYVSSTGSEKVGLSFFEHLLLWAAGWRATFFYLVNLELVPRPTWISNCEIICRQKLLNMEKSMILL